MVSLITSFSQGIAQQLGAPSRPASSAVDSFAAYVAEASRRFGIPAAWIDAVMRVESGGEIGATSSAGAVGLMQVMPATYAALRAQLGLGANAYDPHDNIMAGAAYLREMHDRYGDGGFVAAYNAGPARYEGFLGGGRRLPSESILYMARLGPMLGIEADPTRLAEVPTIGVNPEEAPIFVSLTGRQSASGSRHNSPPNVQLAAAALRAGEQTNALFTARRPTIDNYLTANTSVHWPSTQMQNDGNVSLGLVQLSNQLNGIFVRGRPVGKLP